MTSLDQRRGWWASRQGLSPATAPTTIAAAIKRVGWLATSGAPTAYLSIRARVPGASRSAIDRLAMGGVHAVEVPGLAGRPHLLVPADDVPLFLRFHAASFQAHVGASFAKDGVTQSAFRAVSAQVVAALDECPLSTSDLRQAVTHRDAGVLLRIAVSDLMLRGIVRRFPSNGRIDSTDYRFELRHPDDRPDVDGVGDAAAVTRKAVEHFLEHQGPATIDEVCAWGDFTKGTVRPLLQSIGEPDWKSFKPEKHERVAFLPYRDPFVHARRTPSMLTRATGVRVLDSRYNKQVVADLADVTELDHHTIACGNKLVGIWEYDLKAKAVVTKLWTPTARLRRLVADAAEDTTVFIRDELGDAKLSAVDPPEKRAKRLAFCRAS